MRASPLMMTAILLLVGGVLFRLYPVMLGQPSLSQAFMTEDGYLMLTVARNMAIGLGMTVSEGTIPTNGVQPLATLLFAIPYALTDGDKVEALAGVHLIATAIALAGAFAVRAFAARLLRPRGVDPVWAWGAAALWFIGPLLLRHTMNGLETGLYTLALLLTLLQFWRVLDRGPEAGLADRLALGALTGIVFLARNDAVFLVIALFTVWALDDLLRSRIAFRSVLSRIVPPGLVSLAIAAPWLINNQLRFGSIVPISGTAQSLDAGFGQNAGLLPATLFEHMFPMLPVPGSFETVPAAHWAFTAVLAFCLGLFFAQTIRRGGAAARAIVMVYVLHAVALAVYYGLFFGAPHFMGRYLAPVAPLLIVAALSVALDLGRWILPRRPALLATGYVTVGILLSVALLARLPFSTTQGHTQVVAWVESNLPQTTWVGAVQTGTLGYWHDRTINLDGKVNPAALAEIREKGHVLDYVVASRIDYIADWYGVGGWIDRPEAGFAESFELVLRDRDRNLAVLKRRATVGE